MQTKMNSVFFILVSSLLFKILTNGDVILKFPYWNVIGLFFIEEYQSVFLLLLLFSQLKKCNIGDFFKNI